MSMQHPWPHVMGNLILISITVSEIWDHCQNLLDDPRNNAQTNIYKEYVIRRDRGLGSVSYETLF